MIRFKKLKWSNCFSYANNNELDFSEYPLLQFIGKNGHGKTSIALILEEILYNKNSKGIKKADVLNRYTMEKFYTISLEFEKDDDTYIISSKRGATQSVKLECNGIDISSHTSTGTYKLIEEIMGMDHKTFSQIIYQSSVSSLEFLTATDSVRKKFLIDLLNVSHYTERGEDFKAIAKSLETEVTQLKAKIESTNSWLVKNQTSKLEFIELVPVLNQPTVLVEELSKCKQQLVDIQSTNKRIAQNNKYKEAMSGFDITPVGAKPIDTLAKLKDAKAKHTQVLNTSLEVLTKMARLDGQCPTCLQILDHSTKTDLVHEHTRSKILAKAEVDNLTKEINSQQIHLDVYKRKITELEMYEQYAGLYDAHLTTELLDRDTLESSIRTLEVDIKSILDAISKANAWNKTAEANNVKIEVIKQQIEEFKSELKELSSKLKIVETRLNRIQILVKTFGPSGLVAYKIECLVKDLEEQTNNYLNDLSDGRFQLSFQINTSDKLNVIITDNGKDIEILALSGGERARVNVATLLGIRKLLQSISNNRVNLLILDETTENLDVEGKEKLVEVLLQEEYLNTVLISHSFSHPLIEKVNIIKTKNISRIE